MRYNGIIILRITDFRDYFSFDEFWKNRKLFPAVSLDKRFCWNFDQTDTVESHCIKVVNEWLEGKSYTYYLSGSALYSGSGRKICYLDEEVLKYLTSQGNPLLKSDRNVLGLCALFQLFKGDRVAILNNEMDSVIHALTLASLDYSRPLVEFEEGGKSYSSDIKVCHGEIAYPIHLVWIKNKSSRHKIELRERKDDDGQGRTIRMLKPGECILAVFSSDGSWVKELPCYGKMPDRSIYLQEKKDKAPERDIVIKFRNNKEYPLQSESVLSICVDKLGYLYVVNDRYRPIRSQHPDFVSDDIRHSLEERLEDGEVVLYVEIQNKALSVYTTFRNIVLSQDDVKK